MHRRIIIDPMVEIFPAQFSAARPLFNGQEFHLPVAALFAGNLEGQVFVDRPAQPLAALMLYKNRLRLAGSPTLPEFNGWLGEFLNDLSASLATAGEEVFLVYCPTPEWDAALEAMLAGHEVFRSLHRYYELLDPAPNPSLALPDGYLLHPVDCALLESSLSGLDSVREEMCSERTSVEDFLAHSLGVCLVYEGQVAGWCMSEYNSGKRCEIGIATYDPHKRKGLARLTALALMAQARARGILQIGWHCHAKNEPSVATALSLGFTPQREYTRFVVVCGKNPSG